MKTTINGDINPDPYFNKSTHQQQRLTTLQKVGIGVLGGALNIGILAGMTFANLQFLSWAYNGYSNKLIGGAFLMLLAELLTLGAAVKKTIDISRCIRAYTQSASKEF